MKYLFIVFLTFSLGVACSHKELKEQGKSSNPYTQCQVAKEYITALEFLRSNKEWLASDSQAQEIASKVAQGCDGAARRFIKVSSVLMKAELGTRDSMNLGVQFANSTDPKAETFLAVFKMSYLKSHLDLDLVSSVKTAKSLSLEYKYDDGFVAKDFSEFVSFCSGESKLDLPKPECARFSRRLAGVGYKYKEPVYKPFYKAFEFLISEEGPQMPTHNALKYAEKIVNQGPLAVNNFIAAFKYGKSDKGLKLSYKDAIKFADNISIGSSRAIASESEKGKKTK